MRHIVSRSTLKSLVEDGLVNTAYADNKRRAAIHSIGTHQSHRLTASHDRGCGAPCVIKRVIANPAVISAVSAVSAKQVEECSLAAVLHRSHRLQPGLARKIGQPLPLPAIRILEAVSPVSSHTVGLAASHINISSAVGTGHIVESHRQPGQRSRHYPAAVIAEQGNRRQALSAISAANHHHALRHTHTYAVGHAVGQRSYL